MSNMLDFVLFIYEFTYWINVFLRYTEFIRKLLSFNNKWCIFFKGIRIAHFILKVVTEFIRYIVGHMH